MLRGEVMFKTSLLNQSRLPLVIEPDISKEGKNDVASLISLYLEHRDFFETRLLEHGALLFRGFALATAASLDQFARSVSGGELLSYRDGTSPRTKVAEGVYTSTEYPPAYFISLHNELSYTHKWPTRLFFLCAVAPLEGGETPIVDSRVLLNSMPADIVEQFRRRGVKYVRNLHGGRGFGLSWQSVFETHDKSIVERYCEEGGVEFKWKENGGLRMSHIRSAIATHPQTREEVWFNQADQFHPTEMDQQTLKAVLSMIKEEDLPKNAYFGDGASLDEAMLETIRETTRSRMILFPWQTSDLLMLDNMLVAHGRMPFKGPRKILAALA
jgi:alpha-ketoglutarate-dependent taurine dioxygenase